MSNALTPAQYTAMVTKMVENHGSLDASSVVARFEEYLSQAYDLGMTPVRCANNISKKLEMGQ